MEELEKEHVMMITGKRRIGGIGRIKLDSDDWDVIMGSVGVRRPGNIHWGWLFCFVFSYASRTLVFVWFA